MANQNIITDMVLSVMPSISARDKEMRLRVGGTAIVAQSLAEDFAKPDRHVRSLYKSPITFLEPMQMVALADLKHIRAGRCSTFTAARYYNDKAKSRRDELLEKYQSKTPEEE